MVLVWRGEVVVVVVVIHVHVHTGTINIYTRRTPKIRIRRPGVRKRWCSSHVIVVVVVVVGSGVRWYRIIIRRPFTIRSPRR